MAKSMVEKYEQILSSDPGSMVFVELAKALLDRGDSRRAIEVCQSGLQHHPESVVGRVLWGKALISCGKPAEAMQQFDEAIAIDRENPYAYNLIGEVLLHKGLHRSALPILKKAVALQPNDTRVRQWLDQTTRALNGEKVTVTPQYTTVDPPPAAESTVPSRPSLPATGEPTVTDAKAYSPEPDGAGPAAVVASGQGEVMRGMTDVFQSLAAREESPRSIARAMTPGPVPAVASAPPQVVAAAATAASSSGATISAPSIPAARTTERSNPGERNASAELPSAAVEPAAASPSTPDSSDASTVVGPAPARPTTPARAAQATRAADVDRLSPALAPPAPVNVLARDPAMTMPPPEPRAQNERVRMSRPADFSEAPLPEELVAATLSMPEPRPDLTMPGPPPPTPTQRAPDDTLDLPPAPSSISVLPSTPASDAARPTSNPGGPPPLNLHSRPKIAAAPASAAPPPIPRSASGKNLLPELPTFASGATPSMELPKVELSTQAAEAIAREYERELREKLAAAANQPKSFLQLHGLKLGIAGLILALGGVGYGVFRYAKHTRANLPELMAKAHAGIEKDTASSYDAALTALSDLLEVSPNNAEAHALSAYAHAVVYREHGQKPADRDAALAELSRPEVDSLYPDLAAAARYYLADSDADARVAAKPLAAGKSAEAHEITGKLLLEADPRRALEQFQESLKAQPNHVRTYVAIGDYYLQAGESAVATTMFSQARALSDHHPSVLIGLANARLSQGKELEEAAADLDLLEKESTKIDPDAVARLDLAEGRLLAARGQASAGLDRLNEGLLRAPTHALEFHEALSDVFALQGAYDKALAELQAAQKSRSGAERDLGLLDQVARAEIAIGKPQEALRLTDKIDDRRIRLTRGIALFSQGSHEAAKRELLLTRRDKSMPTEAAIYLARSEIAAGHKDDARPAIEAIVAAGKLSPKAQVARGELAAASGDLAAAKQAFTAASEDPREFEAPYLLGRVLLGEGKIADAVKPLGQSVERNHFFSEGHRTLGRALLALGEPKEARAHLQTYLKEHKDDAVALAGLARASLMLGSIGDARTFAKQAVDRTGRDPEVIWTKTQVDLAAGDGPVVLRDLERRAKALRSADAWCDLGDAALDLDDAKAALAAYAKAAKIERTLPRAHAGMAIANAQLKGKGEVKELLDLAAPSNKLPPMQQARVLAMVARLSPAAEQKARASEAVAASEASAQAHLALGIALGKTAEAVPELTRAVALEPALAEAHLALAEAYAGTGDTARATQSAAVALRIAPRGSVADRARPLAGAAAHEESAPRQKSSRGGKKRKSK